MCVVVSLGWLGVVISAVWSEGVDKLLSVDVGGDVLVWLAEAVLVLDSGESWGDIAVAVEEVLESLDAVLEEELEGGLLVGLVLGKDLSVLLGLLPGAVGGGVEALSEGGSLGADLLFDAGDGLFGEVPDPLLDAVNDGAGVVLLVGASAVSLGLGILEEGADVVLEVMVIDLADTVFNI